MWRWFKDLDGVRPMEHHGPGHIDFVQIGEWSRLRRVSPADWELDALLDMDRERLRLHDENRPKYDDRGNEIIVSKTPLTTALFDTLITGKPQGPTGLS